MLVTVSALTSLLGLWTPEIGLKKFCWTETLAIGIKAGIFAAQATATSMKPLIPDGSMRLARQCPAYLH